MCAGEMCELMVYVIIYSPGAPVGLAHGREARCCRHTLHRAFLMDNRRQKVNHRIIDALGWKGPLEVI